MLRRPMKPLTPAGPRGHLGVRRQRASDPQGPRVQQDPTTSPPRGTPGGGCSPGVRIRASRLRGDWPQPRPRKGRLKPPDRAATVREEVPARPRDEPTEHAEPILASSSTPDTGLSGAGGSCIGLSTVRGRGHGGVLHGAHLPAGPLHLKSPNPKARKYLGSASIPGTRPARAEHVFRTRRVGGRPRPATGPHRKRGAA